MTNVLKNHVCVIKIIKFFKLLKLCEIINEMDTSNFLQVENIFNHFWNIFSYLVQNYNYFFHIYIVQLTIYIYIYNVINIS